METDLPAPVEPFQQGTFIVKFQTPSGEAQGYVTKYFPEVPVTRVLTG